MSKYTIDCTDNQAQVINQFLKGCGFGHNVEFKKSDTVNDTPEYQQGWKDREYKAQLDEESLKNKIEYQSIQSYDEALSDVKALFDDDCISANDVKGADCGWLKMKIEAYKKECDEDYQNLKSTITDLMSDFSKTQIKEALVECGLYR